MTALSLEVVVSPTPLSLRRRVLRLRLALIGIAALALPGAVRSVNESFLSRALERPGARWRVVATTRPFIAPVRVMVPRPPRLRVRVDTSVIRIACLRAEDAGVVRATGCR
ncbi:MAG TPA: hypothetical protein VHM30_12745 [Gemmatimonadaceae bacterium]|nr:hypothetical protein [Gemmatimonadaceae bacterium]